MGREEQREYERSYYERNRAAIRTRVRQWRKNRRQSGLPGKEDSRRVRGLKFIAELRKAVLCLDCGRSYPACAMDFDHCAGVKADCVSQLVRSGKTTTQQLIAEIDKCEPVCANCHRIRTVERSYA